MSHSRIHEHLQRHIVIVGLLIIAAGLIAASKTLHEKADQLIIWIADWIKHDRPLLGKPTHFESRSGKF